MKLKRILSLLIAASMVVEPLSISYAQNYNLPSLGEAGGAALSPMEEKHIGQEIMNEIRTDPTYLDDPETNEYLTRLGYRLVSAGPANNYNYTFFPTFPAKLP